MQMRFVLQGISPLLMHADSVEASERVKSWQKDPANKNLSVPGDDRSPAWTWQGYTYNDDSSIVMPSDNIMVALRQAGAQVILKKQKTFKELTQSGMLISTEFCQFFCNGKQIPWKSVLGLKDLPFVEQCDAARELGFRLWAKRARVGQNKHVRVRPRFDNWEVRGEVQVLAPELTNDILKTIFDIAGRVGLGDWRPGCKTPGSFGMFKAVMG